MHSRTHRTQAAQHQGTLPRRCPGSKGADWAARQRKGGKNPTNLPYTITRKHNPSAQDNRPSCNCAVAFLLSIAQGRSGIAHHSSPYQILIFQQLITSPSMAQSITAQSPKLRFTRLILPIALTKLFSSLYDPWDLKLKKPMEHVVGTMFSGTLFQSLLTTSNAAEQNLASATEPVQPPPVSICVRGQRSRSVGDHTRFLCMSCQ